MALANSIKNFAGNGSVTNLKIWSHIINIFADEVRIKTVRYGRFEFGVGL